MRILFLDSETTGLPLWKEPSDHPDQPHVVDLACDLFDDDVLIDRYDTLIDPGVLITPELIAIHGITNEMVQADGVKNKVAVQRFLAMAERADLIVGHNVSFDIRMMNIASARGIGVKWKPETPTFCTMRQSTDLCQIPAMKGSGWKWPKLTEAVKHFFGEDMPNAHRARPDCDASRRVYRHLLSVMAQD